MDSQDAPSATTIAMPAPLERTTVQNLLNSGAMDDLCWPADRARKNAKNFLQRWWKAQKDMTWTLSTVTYIELKEVLKKGHIDAAKIGDPDTFMVIASGEEHHAIVDERGVILGYRYRIPEDLITTLTESSLKLPPTGMDAGVRGQYPTRHYAVWREYALEPFFSSEYQKDLPASAEWCKENVGLFKFLSNGLRMISPQTYARYGGARRHLEEAGLEPLCGIWFGVAVNQGVTGDTKTHQDWGDYGYNCVVPWGEYQGGGLILWQLKIVVELRPGDAFFFMGSLIAHNVRGVEGIRNSIDLFCHHTVLSWKDRYNKKRRGVKLELG
jgi:hypothetical protein